MTQAALFTLKKFYSQLYQKSLNTDDVKLAQSLYIKDTIFLRAESPSGIGSEGIFKSYEVVFSQIQRSMEFFIEEIQVEGNMVFAVTISKGTACLHTTGDTIHETNRELFVFETVNSECKMARYRFNKPEPEAILDRIVHDAHRVELKGESLRKIYGVSQKKVNWND